MHPSIRTTLVAVLAALALLLAACGGDDDTTAVSGDATGDGAEDQADADAAAAADDAETVADEATFPVTVTSGGLDTTIDARPEAIVSLSPSATEMLFAIGAGDQVVAVDEYSDFPPEAPTTDLSGFEPNLEAVIGYDPDLVVIDASRDELVQGLAAVDVATLVVPAAEDLDATFSQIELLGVATGHVGDAAEVVGQMQAEIEELVAQVPDRDEPLTYYHELDDTLYTVTSSTFIGEIYGLAGLENVADAADPDGEAFGYPQLSAEFLIDADPDLIFLADTRCCAQDATTVAARPGFAGLSAVQAGHVIELDDDIASRWGPRVVDFLRSIVEATVAVEPAGAGA